MFDIYPIARPLFFALDPETAHKATLRLMKTNMLPACPAPHDPALEQIIWGLKFPNPVGLAAGFDKNAEVIGPAFKMGFGFIEAGTVTPKPQRGNPHPRIFRDAENEAVINRMGFPNAGANTFKANLERFLGSHSRPAGVIGLNIGMNKKQTVPAKDYALLIGILGPMADYITINISSPNTPGLRDLQKREPLLELMEALHEARKKACREHPPPILVKFAPDLDDAQRAELAAASLEAGIDGLILGNTTLDRPETLPADFRTQKGGLSGAPLREKSTKLIHDFYALTRGKIPIIGVGGVSSGADAYEKIRAGASLVQLYSALVFHGPGLIRSIRMDLAALLKQNGYSHIKDAIGAAHA